MSFQLLQYARTLALSSRKTPSGKLAESLALYHPMVIEEQQITDNSTRALCFIPETNACCMYIYERYGRLYIMHDIHSPLHDDTSRGVFNKRVLLDACEMKFQSILNQSYMQVLLVCLSCCSYIKEMKAGLFFTSPHASDQANWMACIAQFCAG